MTREEAKKLIRIICASYPNYHPVDISETIDVWTMMLEEYEYNHIAIALKAYITGDTSGFAPSIGQLIDKLHTITTPEELNELEAWSMVYRAICNSTYNSEHEFEKLPPPVQKAVGNPAMLREWASMDTDTVQSVEQSHFIRNYRTAIQREKEDVKLPESVKKAIEQVEKEKAKRIEVGTEKMLMSMGDSG